MFNTSRYNLQKYNILCAEETEVVFSGIFSERFLSLVSYGENVFVFETASAQTGSIVQISTGVILSKTLSAVIAASSILSADCLDTLVMNAELSAAVDLSDDAYIISILNDAVNNKAYLVLSISMGSSIMEVLTNMQAVLSTDYLTSSLFFAVFTDAQVTGTDFNHLYTFIDVSIPPGQTLIIDSENFLALLEGINVLDRHTGAWPTLSRNIQDILVDSANGMPLSIKVFYTKRYLS